MKPPHLPVMLDEVIEGLNVTPGKIYLDATLGAGGHSEAILAHQSKVIGLDQDQVALDYVTSHLKSPQLTVILGNFAHLQELVQNQGLSHFDGILFDLGASSMQFDTPERGFSFQVDAPLDMRMSQKLTVTAADLVNALSKKELARLFIHYSQEKRAYSIADHLIRARQIKPIQTTRELAAVVEAVYGYRREGKLHPATKVFQALRIAVNDELGSLEAVLPQALALLNPKGRLVILSFHEGEDRMVKHFYKSEAAKETLKIITPKPLTPSQTELINNPRSRSAKLRIAEKIYV